jgi:hypothetical protein
MPFFRDRILSDPRFLFKVGAEVVIDSGEEVATNYIYYVASVTRRGFDQLYARTVECMWY